MDPKERLNALAAFRKECQEAMKEIDTGLVTRAAPALLADDATIEDGDTYAEFYRQSRWDQLDEWERDAGKEYDTIKARIDRVEHFAEIPDAIEDETTTKERTVPNVNTKTDPYDLSDLPTDGFARMADLNARAFDVIEHSRAFHEDDHRESATKVMEATGGLAAEQTLKVSHPEYHRAYAKYMTGNSDDMDASEKERIRDVKDHLRRTGYFGSDGHTHDRAQIVANTTGILVPSHLDPTVIITNTGAANPFRALSRVVPVTTNVWTGVSSAGITIGWSGVDDQVEVDDDAPSFSSPAVTCAMWDAFVPITFAAYEDWVGGESEIMMMVADAKDRLEAVAFATGSGSNQPVGIITALSGTASQLNHATNSSFTSADLYAVKNALGRRFRPNAAWVGEERYFDRIRGFGTNEGGLYTVSLDAERPDRVLGKPTYDSSSFPDELDTATNQALVYGDFKAGYLVADRVGTISEFVPNLFATGANRPSAQRGWLVHGRTGADSVNDNAFVLSVNPGATG